MKVSAEVTLNAITRLVDDRGYLRITVDELCRASGLSRASVKRALNQLSYDGILQRRAKAGPAGGILIRLTTGSLTGSQSVQQSVQNGEVNDGSPMPLNPVQVDFVHQEPEPDSVRLIGSQSAQRRAHPPTPTTPRCPKCQKLVVNCECALNGSKERSIEWVRAIRKGLTPE